MNDMTVPSNPSLGIYAGDAAAGLATAAMHRYIRRAEAVLPTRASALSESPMEPDNTPDVHLARQTLTFKFRLRDKHAAELNRQARAVNLVWNFANETQRKAAQAKRKWLSAFDLQKLTNGASKELDIHAHTIQRVCRSYDDARKTHKKAWLKWRGKKSLGWVPFNTGHVSMVKIRRKLAAYGASVHSRIPGYALTEADAARLRGLGR